MWQSNSNEDRTIQSHVRIFGGSRSHMNDVIDLRSPPPGAWQQTQGTVQNDEEDDEEEFPYNLSQDSVVSFAIRNTPDNLELGPEFEPIKYEAAPDAFVDIPIVPVNAPPINVEEKVNRVTLNEEQREAANMAIYGRKNIFLTGAAGTGKSFLLRYIIQQLKARRKGDVFVTATTGVAAENIKGTTLHSFAGIGLGEGTVDQLFSKVSTSKPAMGRWKKVKYLIVDEVSMLHVDLFEKLEELARKIKCYKRPDKPFGGIKLILCGDFFQLPPVDRKRSGNKYAFQSTIWTEDCDIQTVALREVHRQTDDTFVNLLNEVRIGKFSDHSRLQLDACHINVKPLPNDGILPTKLYCLNKNVDAENLFYLNKLPHPDFVYKGSDKWVPRGQEARGDDGYESNFEENFQDFDPQGKANMMADVDRKAPLCIRLRVGAQVMYLRNDPSLGLVNGSRGVVTELCDARPTVKFDNGTTVPLKFEQFVQFCTEGKIVRSYMPLKLAWALTVHKSQGMTLTRVELQLDNAFECGQVYVALSRVKSLPGLFIRGGRITPDLVRADENVLATFGPQGRDQARNSTMGDFFPAVAKRKRHENDPQSRATRQRSPSNGDGLVSDSNSSESASEDDYAKNKRKNTKKASKTAKKAAAKHKHEDENDYEDFRHASSGSSSGGDSSGGSSSSSRDSVRRRADSAVPVGKVDVIDLISPDRIQLAAQRVHRQDASEIDAFQRLVNHHTQSSQQQYTQGPESHRAWETAATQPLPADFGLSQPSSQLSQRGPFSATFSQFREQAYETRPGSSCSSSTSALSSTSSAADAYWRSKDVPYPVGGAYATYGTDQNRDQNRDQSRGTSSRADAYTTAAQQFRASFHPPQPISTMASSSGSQAPVRIAAPVAALAAPPAQVAVREIPRTAASAPARPASLTKAYMYFDGGALGNPGVGGAGYLLYPDSAQPPHEQPAVPFAQAAVRMHGKDCTNNQAEYTGLIHGLQAALALGVRTLAVYGDSELVIKQMKGEYKVKNPVLKGMNQRAQLLAGSFPGVTFNWVKRDFNKPADALSGRAMHQPASAEECAEQLD